MDDDTKAAQGLEAGQQELTAEMRQYRLNFVATQLEGLAKMLREGVVEAIDFSWMGGNHANVNLKFCDTSDFIMLTPEAMEALKNAEDEAKEDTSG